MSEGWIKLHRELLDKSIWTCSTPVQKVILITLLMMANHEGREWEFKGRRIKLQPGQFITSLPSIAKLAGDGVSIQNIRTALKRFAEYEFLTDESTDRGRLITICNWDRYQRGVEETNSQINRPLTDHQQPTNRPLTANNNNKKDNNIIATTTAREAEAIEEESEEDEAGEYGEDARSEEPPQTNLQDDFSANNGEADKLTASGRERAKNRLRIGNSESSYIGQGEVATIRNWWNLEVANERIRKVNAVTGSRKTLLAQRVKEWTLYAYDNGMAQPTMSWQATLAKIATIIRDSPYLQGETPRAQPITFDRLINNDTFWLKILEGQYTDVAPTTSSTTSATTTTNGRNYTTAGETTRRTDLSDGKRDYSVESLQRFLNR